MKIRKHFRVKKYCCIIRNSTQLVTGIVANVCFLYRGDKVSCITNETESCEIPFFLLVDGAKSVLVCAVATWLFLTSPILCCPYATTSVLPVCSLWPCQTGNWWALPMVHLSEHLTRRICSMYIYRYAKKVCGKGLHISKWCCHNITLC